jgi:hypothetical protein
MEGSAKRSLVTISGNINNGSLTFVLCLCIRMHNASYYIHLYQRAFRRWCSHRDRSYILSPGRITRLGDWLRMWPREGVPKQIMVNSQRHTHMHTSQTDRQTRTHGHRHKHTRTNISLSCFSFTRCQRPLDLRGTCAMGNRGDIYSKFSFTTLRCRSPGKHEELSRKYNRKHSGILS